MSRAWIVHPVDGLRPLAALRARKLCAAADDSSSAYQRTEAPGFLEVCALRDHHCACVAMPVTECALFIATSPPRVDGNCAVSISHEQASFGPACITVQLQLGCTDQYGADQTLHTEVLCLINTFGSACIVQLSQVLLVLASGLTTTCAPSTSTIKVQNIG